MWCVCWVARDGKTKGYFRSGHTKDLERIYQTCKRLNRENPDYVHYPGDADGRGTISTFTATPPSLISKAAEYIASSAN